MEKIMVLGGGINQIPLLKKAKNCGYYVVLCDYLTECPGRKEADIHYYVSTYDYDKVKKVAIEESVDGVVTNSEPVLHIVSRLTDELKLPSVPLETMELFLNKDKMRELLTPKGLSDIAYKTCYTKEEALDFYSIQEKKLIMKPIDNSASRGVFSINSETDIENYFAETMRQNRRQSKILLEEYISGEEFTADGICINGKHTTLAISKKKHYSYNENVADELFFSYYDEYYDYDEIRNYNDSIVHATGLPFGMTHSEYKYNNGKYHLIEIAARGGGSFISTKIVPYLSDTDTVKILIDSAMGKGDNLDYKYPDLAKKRVAVLKFFDTPDNREGVVKAIDGLDYLESEKRIIDYNIEFSVGDYIHPANNDSERIGYYIAIAESKSELKKLMSSIDNKFHIYFTGDEI